MKRTQLLQEVRTMRFEEAFEGWCAGCLTQDDAVRILGVCDRTFRRYMARYEVEGLDGLTGGSTKCPTVAPRRTKCSL